MPAAIGESMNCITANLNITNEIKKEVENAKNAEAERLRTEKAYQELLATFDNSPDVTANILSDWMESGDSSAASTGEEAAEEGEETAG